MASVNLGSIKFNWKGAYNANTAYAVDDVVSHSGSSYICILASTGNAPTNTTYWNIMSQGGTDVGTTLTTQGDLLYRDGSGLQRLGAGTSGQFLKTLGTGANPTWGDVAGGIVQIQIMTPNNSSQSTSSTTFVDSGFSVSITPTSSSNRILLMYQSANQGSGNRSFYTFKREGHPSSNGDLNSLLHSNNDGMLSSEVINTLGNDNVTMFFIDNPQTTSALTYKFRYRNGNGSTTYLNNGGTFAYFIAIELDGGVF